jgi:hypothetical protein
LLQALLTGCSDPPRASVDIEKALDEIEQAVEDNKELPVLNRMHDDFELTRSGREMSRYEAKQLLGLTLRRHRDVGIVITNLRVEPDPVRGDAASARFNAMITSKYDSRLLPDSGQIYRVESEWRLEDERWLLYRLDSRRALE